MNPLNPPNPRLKNDLCNSCNLRSNHPAQSMNTISCVPDSGLRQRQAPRSPSAATPPNPLKMSVIHPLGPQYHGARSAVPRSTVRSATERGPQCQGPCLRLLPPIGLRRAAPGITSGPPCLCVPHPPLPHILA